VKVVLFCHSLLSDWNHGNAHFLRGVCSELHARGHDATAYEPENSWSYQNLLADGGERFLAEFKAAYPNLRSVRYGALDLEEVLSEVELAIVHEWNAPDLIGPIGAIRARSSAFRLFFHDSHHRAATQPETMAKLDLRGYATEGLFRAGKDFLFAEDGKEMTARLDSLLTRPSLAKEVVANGLQTIRNKHTCAQRVDQLLEILDEINREE